MANAVASSARSPRPSAASRRSAPFRRTFDTATEAAQRFHAENLDFLQPILDRGEPREAVREWLRSNAHGRVGRMKVKDLSQTPWAAKMLAAPDPVMAALRNVFAHAKGRRWDRADWDAIRALGETLAEFAGDSEGAGPSGWTWFPIAIEDDDAKILDRLSAEGEPDAYRRFATSLSEREVEGVVATYEREVQRLARCMSPQRRRHIEARLAEIRTWTRKGIPESVCGQAVYAGHTCDLEPLHGELMRLRDACESDAAYAAWRNEAVRRSARAGSVAQAENDEVPVELVPVAAFEGDAPVTAETCTPSEAARIMGRLGAAKRRENAAKRRKVRDANAAARKAEREQVSKARKVQRAKTRRKAPVVASSTSSTSTEAVTKAEVSGKMLGADLRFFGRDADSKDRRLKHAEGIAVLEGKPAPSWVVYVFAYPKARKFQYVRGNGEFRVVVSGPQGLASHLAEALRRLRRDRDADTLAKDELAMLDTLAEFQARLPETAVSSTPARAARAAASGRPAPNPRRQKTPVPKAAVPKRLPPPMPARGQGSLVTAEEEGFALTHPRGTAGVHGSSAGRGGTQNVLPGVSRKVSATKLAEMKERERVRRIVGRSSASRARARQSATPAVSSAASADLSAMTTAKLQALLFELEGEPGVDAWPKARAAMHFESIGAATAELFARGVLEPVLFGGGGVNERPLTAMSTDDLDNAFRGEPPDFAAPRWLVTNLAYVLAPQFEGGGLSLIRGPQSKASERAESLYVVREGVLLAYGGQRARVTVRRRGGYFVVEVEGMPRSVVRLVESAVRTVLGDPTLQMRAQDGSGMTWRRA